MPSSGDYRQDESDEDAAVHVRAAPLGESARVPIEKGRLALGAWQSIIFVEWDGPRSRRLRVAVTGA